MLRLLLLLALARGAMSLDVLLVSVTGSPSHYIFANALAEGLLQRGHKVTELVIRAPAVRHPNRTSYVVDAPPFDLGNDLDAFAHHSLWEDVTGYFEAAKVILASPLASPAFHKLLRHLREDRPHFDVFVQEYVLQEPLLGLNALIGRPPVVTFTAYNMPEDVLDLMGSPFLPSLLPIQGVGVHDCEPMVFRERAYNLLKWIAFKTYYFWEHRPWISQTITETFPEAPPLEDLQRDVAASLVNTNPALHGAIPLVPGIVEVGGVQAKPAKPAEALPADLLAWLDGAAHGFVFVSFGSNVKAENLKKDRVEAMLRAFGRVKQRVLWKYEDKDILARLPPNVRVHKWLPQNDILGHPGIRCFVTHNGGLSTQEAAYHGVPLLAVPFFMDQLLYAVKTERTGLGRSLSYTDIAEDTVYEALTDVIENPRYKENAVRVQWALRDQKETPLERAVWWIEYAARSGGAPHLRSPALRLRWYQLYMLDVLAAALAVTVATVYLASLLLHAAKNLILPAGSRKLKTK